MIHLHSKSRKQWGLYSNTWKQLQLLSVISREVNTVSPIVTSALPCHKMLQAGWSPWELSHHPVQAGLGKSQGDQDGIQLWDTSWKWRMQSQLLLLLFNEFPLFSPSDMAGELSLMLWSCSVRGFFAGIWEYFLLVMCIYLRPLEAITHTQIFPCRHCTLLNFISVLWCYL